MVVNAMTSLTLKKFFYAMVVSHCVAKTKQNNSTAKCFCMSQKKQIFENPSGHVNGHALSS